jgi:hypothetical protein
MNDEEKREAKERDCGFLVPWLATTFAPLVHSGKWEENEKGSGGGS